ncbi:UNVERIFIED_ORG: diguanylate cyclase (GGDEF)-like protein/PAS domain S-box-containing protein [Rhizobium esperanzae]
MTRSSTLIDIDSHPNARLLAELDHRTKVTPAMLHSIDKQGRLISVSDAWLAKLGYAREEVIGRPSSEFLTPESRMYAIREVLPAFFLSGRIDNVEYQMVCKDGRIIDVLLSAVLDDSLPEMGSVSVAVITDVTAFKAAEQQLILSEARYRELVESQSELVSLASPEGVFSFVNHAYARHYGLQPHEMVGRNLFDFIPEDSRAAVAEHLRMVCGVSHSVEIENQVVLPDGRVRWMAWTNTALFDSKGQVTTIHSVGRDIDDRVAAERRLQESESRYRLLADHSTDMVLQLDRDLVRRYVSPACREILGFQPEELIGAKPIGMAHPEDAPGVALVFQSLLEGRMERHSIISRVRHRDGHWIWVEAQLKALKDPTTSTVSGIIGTLRDVSARKAIEDQLQEANRRLQALAEQDALTGLANRRYFDEALLREHAHALSQRTNLALLMIDVDRFKSFNDRYGHPSGDECLKRIGGAIKDTIRRAGDVAARYGGEEFAVLLPGADGSEAASVAELIRLAVLHLGIEHEASPNGVATISVGVTGLTGDSSCGPEALVREADRALYRAKERGRNTVVIAHG